jgi:hypothetical protein
MRDTEELRLIDGLVLRMDAHYGSLRGAISIVVVAIVAWMALKEAGHLVLDLLGRQG